MAYRRHIIAVRNSTPEAFHDALASLKVSEVETANDWCWAMASVWFTGAHELLDALVNFDGPYFVATTEDACRWRFHLRKSGKLPFDTMHEFHWIGRKATAQEVDETWDDLYEETDRAGIGIEFPNVPPVPASSLAPLDFEDDFFEEYEDDELDDEDDEGDDEPATPFSEIVDTYSDYGLELPAALVAAIEHVPPEEIYREFLALHALHIADALTRFDVPHDRAEVLRILTGENVTEAEMDGDAGNLWRFLDHLGLGPKFAAAIEPPEESDDENGVRYDPAGDVLTATGDLALHSVDDGPVAISLEEVFLLARCAYYQDGHPEYVVRVRWEGAHTWPQGTTPGYAEFTEAEGGATLFVHSAHMPVAAKARKRLGALFQQLPEGATVELLSKGEHTRIRFAGSVAQGHWQIDSASVPLAREDFDTMLTVFRAAEARGPQFARDAEEADAIIARAMNHMYLYDKMPHRDGLQLSCGGRAEAEALGALFFRQRLAHRWDFSRIEAILAEDMARWRQTEEEMARQAALPATEKIIYAGEASRFLEADYDASCMDRAMRIKARRYRGSDREMAELGFACLGAVVLERVGGGIIRCYANADERAYGCFYALPFGQTWHDFFTYFEDDTTLTTTNGMSEGSLRSLRILSRLCGEIKIRELLDEHREGIGHLAERGMLPAEIDPSMEGICKAMDSFLVRRLGEEET